MKNYSKIFKVLFLIASTVMLFSEGCFGIRISDHNQDDACVIKVRLKGSIENYIENGDESIYSSEFITSFSIINEYHDSCYFPGNNQEVKLYFFLGEKVLLEKLKSDERAMRLLIDLYLLNKNNVELSQYYGSVIIPQAIIRNTKAFVKVLANKEDKEINKCIGKLKYIDSKADIDKINKKLKKLKEPEYIAIANKMREKLQ